MRIYILYEQVFVRVEKGHLLCIGTREEFDQATPERVIEMIEQARVLAQYKEIEVTNTTVH